MPTLSRQNWEANKRIAALERLQRWGEKYGAGFSLLRELLAAKGLTM
jgi:hypothetical protein